MLSRIFLFPPSEPYAHLAVAGPIASKVLSVFPNIDPRSVSPGIYEAIRWRSKLLLALFRIRVPEY